METRNRLHTNYWTPGVDQQPMHTKDGKRIKVGKTKLTRKLKSMLDNTINQCESLLDFDSYRTDRKTHQVKPL